VRGDDSNDNVDNVEEVDDIEMIDDGEDLTTTNVKRGLLKRWEGMRILCKTRRGRRR
jgi:hypothetical protein